MLLIANHWGSAVGVCTFRPRPGEVRIPGGCEWRVEIMVDQSKCVPGQIRRIVHGQARSVAQKKVCMTRCVPAGCPASWNRRTDLLILKIRILLLSWKNPLHEET